MNQTPSEDQLIKDYVKIIDEQRAKLKACTEKYSELRHEVELCLKGLPTAFGQILQKHDAHENPNT